jgi:pimeloyl-ACP methyl ester carboxylesterase
VVGFSEYGDPAGDLVVYLHGFPGSRFEARWLAKAAGATGIRLIGIDRPGIGLSQRQRGRRVVDFSDDLAEFADRVGADRFGIIGFSGGAPYALATAWKIPERLTACVIVSGAGPVGGFKSLVARFLPWIASPLIRRRFLTEDRARRALRSFARRWSAADRAALDRPDIEAALVASVVEAFRNGAAAVARDATLLGCPWGFRLQDIGFRNIHLWHGEADRIVPHSIARSVMARLPRCSADLLPNEGHFSLIANHSDAIMASARPRR